MKNTAVMLAGFGIFAGSLFGAGALSRPINDQRRDLNLEFSDSLYDMPPEMAVAQAALGTMRGVAVNVIWQRAENLKQEGKYHEAVQLGEWITTLQPRFPQVWEFVSWNQAYNISVGTSTASERWYWVRSGIDVLQRRGGGLDANPHELRLYQQLAWIYFHKVGQFQDNFNWFYKQQLADEWQTILGTPPAERRQYLAWLADVVDAPARAADLSPDGRRLASWVETQVSTIPSEALARLTLDRVEPHQQRPAQGDEAAPVPPADESAAGLPRDLVPERAWPSWADEATRRQVTLHLRRRAVTSDTINMDPARMLADAERHGPLDWRHPGAHAVYWSERGLERRADNLDRWDGGVVNVRRNLLNGLQMLAQSGQVVYDPATMYVSYLPAFSFWLSYDAAYRDELDAELARERITFEQWERAYGGGYRNQMDQAIVLSDLFGARAVSDELFGRMSDRYRDTEFGERYAMRRDDFMRRALADTLENPDTARSVITALLFQSLASSTLYNNPREAERLMSEARRLYGGWRDINSNPNDPLYREIPPFEQLQIDVMGTYLAGEAGPMGAQQIPIEVRASVWRTLTEEAQAFIYGRFGNALQNAALAEGFDPSRVFPPPRQVLRQGRPVEIDETRRDTPPGATRAQRERR